MTSILYRFRHPVWAALVLVVVLLVASACKAPAREPETPPYDGAIIQTHDPRDADQCRAQPDLAWCRAACEPERYEADPKDWCDVK